MVTHPPYSPDLAPCDWFLFLSVERQLKGKQFQNAEEGILEFSLDTPQSTWPSVIDSWFERIVMCVQAEGVFFEKVE